MKSQIEGAADEDQGRAAVRARLVTPKADRLLVVAEALRRGLTRGRDLRGVALRSVVRAPDRGNHRRRKREIRADGLPKDADGFRALKAQGFSDARLAKLTGQRERDVRAARRKLGVRPQFKRID